VWHLPFNAFLGRPSPRGVEWLGLVWVSGIPPSCFSCSLNIGTEIHLRSLCD
jgi:hypothetical protein